MGFSLWRRTYAQDGGPRNKALAYSLGCNHSKAIVRGKPFALISLSTSQLILKPLRIFEMAEVNDANATGTALPEASAVTNETTMQADTQMTDDVVASEIGGSLVEASAVEALPPDTAAPDGFTRNVEDNLVTSRHAPLIDHETSSRNQASNTTATQSLPNDLELREGSPVPVPPSTATATGSLAPSAPPTSRITFDGTFQPIVSCLVSFESFLKHGISPSQEK